jgi:aminopeptidase
MEPLVGSARLFPESGGLNQSAIHWDILKDMRKSGEIYAEGELFYKNGKLLLK